MGPSTAESIMTDLLTETLHRWPALRRVLAIGSVVVGVTTALGPAARADGPNPTSPAPPQNHLP